jgi:hypothetical protein
VTFNKKGWIRWTTLAIVLAYFPFPLSAAHEDSQSIGESIYQRGILPSGALLTATREEGMSISGQDAACINCHRRSGLGTTEGRSSIPPITGRYLFHPRAATLEDLDLPFVPGARADRDPYTNQSLAHAIRDGFAADGRELSYLMPRYALNDDAMTHLIEYLNHLTQRNVPGVTASVLHFATIITPDADPIKRQGMLSVLENYFRDKNAFTRAQSPRLHASQRIMFRVNRTWQLHIWQLTGTPDSWEAQLHQHLKSEPVFAVISGLGGKTWAPVHQFCQHESLPCLFPNVELPVVSEQDFYSLYFTKGVLLEAQLIAKHLAAHSNDLSQARIIQVARAGDVGEAAARAFESAANTSSGKISTRILRSKSSGSELSQVVKDIAPQDVLILWLRPDDLARLPNESLPTQNIYLSGLMGNLGNAPVPGGWRASVRIAYPFDLPGLRRVRMDYPLGWFKLRHIPVVDEQVQADTYLAVGLLAETLSHMVDTFERDYLIERIEEMLEHRIITGYYPRLALAPGQRFASKGGYVVRFKDATGSQLVADSEWLVP